MIWEHYGALQNAMEVLRIVKGCYGTLQSVVGYYRTLQKHYGVLQSITEHYGALRDVMERYGSVTELLQNVTEPLQKILILPTINLSLNFAYH